MKILFKHILSGIILLSLIVCLTASTTPGFDEDGNDIDECQQINACPPGYICFNIPGNYYCGIVVQLETQAPPDTYDIQALCTGFGQCAVYCKDCLSIYNTTNFMGRAKDIRGYCECGSTNFTAY